MGAFNSDDLPLRSVTEEWALKEIQSVGADDLDWSGGGFSDPTEVLTGQTANNTTETHEGQFGWTLPAGYAHDGNISASAGEAATDDNITIQIDAQLTGTPATSANMDLICKVSDRNGGTSGSDLVATAAQDMTANGTSWATYSFTITGDNLNEGDRLSFCLRSVINDSGGSGGGR